MLSLRERLALKKAETERALGPKTPLSVVLNLYLASPTNLYVNYMEEFKLLCEWLRPFDVKGLRGSFPRLLGGYELQEMAKIIGCSQYELYISIMEIEKQKNFD